MRDAMYAAMCSRARGGVARAKTETDLMDRYGAARAAGCAAVALSYGEGDYAPPEWARAASRGSRVDRHGAAIARFARANWYAELDARLAQAVAASRAEFSGMGLDPGRRSDWRRLVNSPLPERPVALAAGLGWIGRNGIMVAGTPDKPCAAGSACVLGILLLPFDPAVAARPQPAACGSCRRCVDACPTGALSGAVGYDRELCLQHWSTIPGDLPPVIASVWADRLYGCDSCLEACPHFRPDPAADTHRGRLGARLTTRFFIESDDKTIRGALRGTALGLGWMPPAAFRRNAQLAALHAAAAPSIQPPAPLAD